MANSLTHNLPYPIKNARFTLPLTFRVAAGTPTDPTTPDTEFSTDGGASFADCAEEVTTGGSNGCGYLTLTGAETNAGTVFVAAKSANDLTTPALLQPRVLASVGTGTLSAGSSGGGTLGTLLAYDVTGCFIQSTGGTGGGGTGGANNQARKIVTYVTSTGAFTVSPNWETTPDATTTYSVLLPEGVTLGMLKTLNPVTPGATILVNSTGQVTTTATVTSGTAQAGSTTSITLASGASSIDGTYDPSLIRIVSGTGSGQARLILQYNGTSKVAIVDRDWRTNPDSTSVYEVIATSNLISTNEGLAQGGAASSITLNATASSVNSSYVGQTVEIRAGTGQDQARIITAYIGATKVATVDSNWNTTPDATSVYVIWPVGRPYIALIPAAPTAAANATAVWQDATAGDFTVSSSIGKALYIANVAPGAAGGHFISGSNAGTTTMAAFTVTGAFTVNSIVPLDATVSSRMATYTQPTGFLAATFPTTVASTTNITAGTITTVTNLTNAPTVGDFTSTMKTSIVTAVWTTASSRTLTSVSGLTVDANIIQIQGNAGDEVTGLAAFGSDYLNSVTPFAMASTALSTVQWTNSLATNLGTTATQFLTMTVLDGSVYQYTANALELAPSGGGGGSLTATQNALLQSGTEK